MWSLLRSSLSAPLLLTVLVSPVAGQQAGSLVADLIRDVSETEKKAISLAGAIPEEKYRWRPAEGVRTVAEVSRHMAADNYAIPALFGVETPASTGIEANDYSSVQAYESRKSGKATLLEELAESFTHLKKAIAATPPEKLGETVTAFGEQFTRQQLLILAVTHLHEHLGQAIAYARSNGIVPPWSRTP